MTFLDIHSHILPKVDDGAKDIETAIKLLEILKDQGVTDVIATPHFYPDRDRTEEFAQKTLAAYEQLKKEAESRNLPNVYLGCELRYFSGMGKSRSLRRFAIKGTDYLLLELPYGAPITKAVLQDIIDIGEQQNLIPIIAHIERYRKVKDYKKLLKLVTEGYALAHINASAVISKEESKCCEKLIKSGIVSYVASDTHSPEHRPPQIKAALEAITQRLGPSVANRLIVESNQLLEEIKVSNEK